MIEVLGPTTESRLVADVCIIGAGIAGLTIARELAAAAPGQKILLAESGGERWEAESQRLNDAEIGVRRYRGNTLGRYRVYGGNSIAWGAQLLPIEREEWSRRDYLGAAGWPISQAEIARYDDRIYSQFGIALRALPRSVEDRFAGATCNDSLRYRCSRWPPFKKRNLANTIGRELRAREDVRVLLRATAIEFVLDESRQWVVAAICANPLRRCSIQARLFIIAAGALESARLLLLSDHQLRNGIGNQSGLVGRYFQDHLSVTVADFGSNPGPAVRRRFAPFFHGRTFYYPRVVATSRAAEAHRLPGIFAHVQVQMQGDNAFDVLRTILQRWQRDGRFQVRARDLRVLVQELPYVSKMALARCLSWPLPYHRLAMCFLQVDVEHLPSLDSRISLSQETDILGMRKLKIDWRIGKIEMEAIAEFVRILRSDLFVGQDGAITWRELTPEYLLEHGCDVYHPSGTTMMSSDAASGVVDTNLKVHGTENLYIASTSVFPCSGSANPSFTLLGLCYRLVDHLKAVEMKSLAPPVSLLVS